MIKLDGIQKVRELEAEDRYKVLEFLVKEMMEIKDQLPHRRQYYDGRHDTPISEEHEKSKRSAKRKENKNIRTSSQSIKVTKMDGKQQPMKEEQIEESISDRQYLSSNRHIDNQISNRSPQVNARHN